MYCAKCGFEMASDARFCPQCGSPAQAAGNPYTGQYGVPYSGPVKGIVRPRQGRMVAGVCIGIANHLGWDVTLVRLILVVLVLGAGTGILAYVIGWIVIPEEPYALPPGTMPPPPPPAY